MDNSDDELIYHGSLLSFDGGKEFFEAVLGGLENSDEDNSDEDNSDEENSDDNDECGCAGVNESDYLLIGGDKSDEDYESDEGDDEFDEYIKKINDELYSDGGGLDNYENIKSPFIDETDIPVAGGYDDIQESEFVIQTLPDDVLEQDDINEYTEYDESPYMRDITVDDVKRIVGGLLEIL